MTMLSGTNKIRNSVQIYNECSEQIELLMSCITKNPDCKSQKCRGCKNFAWTQDRKPSEEKINLLVEEVIKLAFEIECLSIKYQLFHKELKHMQECKVQR